MTKEEVKTEISEGVRELKDVVEKGYVRFSIKADDTESNEAVHDGFKEFCKLECDNNYTVGLKTLLNYYQADYKYETLYGLYQEVKGELNELKAKLEKPKKKEENEEVF